MAKDLTKTSTRTGSLSRSVRARRGRSGPHDGLGTGGGGGGLGGRLIDAVVSPNLGMGLVVAVVFALLCTGITLRTRDQPLVAVGRVMDETRLVRMQIRTEDGPRTQQARELARQATPRVYVADVAVLDAITNSLENLPRTLAAAGDLAAVDPTIQEQFGLTPELLGAVRAEAQDGEAVSSWISKVRTLRALLERRPLLDPQTWQRTMNEGSNGRVRLLVEGKTLAPALRSELINIEDKERLVEAMGFAARDAGFTGPLRALAVNRLTVGARPTYAYDPALTAQDQGLAAEAVRPAVAVSTPGQIIFQRGEMLTEAERDLFVAELAQWARGSETWQRWLRASGIAGACVAVTLALAGYTALFCPRVRRNASRMGGVALILALSLAVACAGTAAAPELGALTSVTPTIFVAMLIAIAYDRRAALAYAMLHGLLACIALREGVGTMAVMITGIACVVWTLKEIRDRNTLFRTSVFTSVGMGAATVVFSLIERPLVEAVVNEVLVDAGLAAGGALLIGGVTLFTLPLIERAFGVTTGMTLIDLRDPKQPLLRELQQRAPGTYNHSLNVATIAESAAEAIGGDGLLTYVGALYHDVGKMNKPEYFVENQAGGPNKHDKLSPAMSLLIVVGHVKDGVELAREFALPPRVLHFVEAHHGTTLVEFFFHRAKNQAVQAAANLLRGRDGGKDGGRDRADPRDGDDGDAYVPDEFEYRYPGPKPRTKEVAILMIADAVESASRAMADPTPGRIDALVRAIANKRLLDGQFDDCELTLRDLHAIVESVSRTVSSMYHGRVAYPEPKIEPAEQRA